MFTEHKITEFKNKIADLADRPQMSAQALKAYFDSSSEELRTKFNALLDELAAFSKTSLSGVRYNAADGKLTFAVADGEEQVIDLPLELLIERGHYDVQTQSIVLELANGDALDIPAGDLVDTYEADETTLICKNNTFSVKEGVFAKEAPKDGEAYARKDGTWERIVSGLEEIRLADADEILDGIYKVPDHAKLGVLCSNLYLYVYGEYADVEQYQTILWSDGRIAKRQRIDPVVNASMTVIQNADGTYRLRDDYVFPAWEAWQSVIPSLDDYAKKSEVDEKIEAEREHWDALVDVTLTENLATEFRHVFDKSYKRLRFKIVFKGQTSLTSVRFKRNKTDGGNSPTVNNYLKYSSGNTSTARYLSATVSYDLDGRIILTNGAETNGTSGFGDKGGATFGGDVSYPEKNRTFPEFFFYLGGSIAEDGTLSGNVLGKGTTIQVWGCDK